MQPAELRRRVDASDFGSDATLQWGPMKPPADLPPEWRMLLESAVPAQVIRRAWGCFEDRLPRTLAAMSRALRGVAFVVHPSQPPSLAYACVHADDVFTFHGGPPADQGCKEMSALPRDFVEFFSLHDGWRLAESDQPILHRVEEWHALASVVDDIQIEARRLGSDQHHFLVVSELESYDLLGFNLGRKPPECVRWSPEVESELQLDHWLEVDESIAATIDQSDPVGLSTLAAPVSDPARVAAIRRRTHELVTRAPALREEAVLRRQGVCLRDLAGQHLTHGLLDYLLREPLRLVRTQFGRASEELATAIELDYVPNADDLLDGLHAALVAGDTKTAQMLGGLPRDGWVGAEIPRSQLRAEVALLRRQDALAARHLERLSGLADNASSETAHNLHDLLDAVLQQDARRLQNALSRRMAIWSRTAAREGPSDDRGWLDLPALGLCRLARDRGLRVYLKHPCLPLELLDVS